MNKLLIATAAVALATVGTAGAADLPARALPVKAPPIAAPVYTWTGCYVSGGVGYGMWNQDNSAFDTLGLGISTATQTAGGRGWLGRVGVGCDYQVAPSFVIGAFGDYDWRDIKGNFHDIPSGFVGEEKNTAAWHAGLRVGYLPFPDLMTFISGGWTQARFDDVTMTDPFGLIPGNLVNFSFPSQTYNGWFIGGGTEYRLPFAQNLTWKTEYRFAQYQAENLPVTVNVLGAPFNAGYSEHMEKFVQTVTTSLVWRFNFGGPGYGFGGPGY
jgi:outer membrane immunogenic protein